jgi:ribosome-associated toxin RatA of RatAB toxin-antitoxin module
MKQVKKSVLIWHSPRAMYGLVIDVVRYPEFLPWCERGEVLEQTDVGMLARLHLAYGGVRHAFSTRNEHVPDESVHLALVDGPFSLLDGTWRFVPLGTPADANAQACRIEFEMRYAFNSKALETVISPVFDRIADTFVDSFVKRAEAVYGKA